MRRATVIVIVTALLLCGLPWASVAAEAVTLSASGWSDPSVGTWDANSKTAALTRDLAGGIRITASGVVLDGAGHTLTGSGSGNGVYIEGQTGVTVKNLAVQGFNYGIYLKLAHGNTLEGNTASGNAFYGIYLNNAGNNTLSGNTASGNGEVGIRLLAAGENTLVGNAAERNHSHGIYMAQSAYNTLNGNTMAGNAANLRVDGESDFEYDNAIDTSNLVEGKPVYYLRNATGSTVDASSNAGVVYLIGCSGITVRDLDLAGNHVSVLLWYTANSRIENVRATGGSIGIWLRNSVGNALAKNTAGENTYAGIYLQSSDSNTLTGNTIRGGVPYGLLLEGASGNQVHNNQFRGNANQAYETGGSGNSFNQPKPKGGNYWDNWATPDADGDGFVDDPYTIDAAQADNLPWAIPAGWETTVLPSTPEPTINDAFVTGGGWFSSPPGALTADAAAAGKVKLALVCRYAQDATVPSGEANVQFGAGHLHSTAFEWLAIEGGSVWCQGQGTIDGAGSYGFLIAVEAGAGRGHKGDMVRLKIWDLASGSVLYDSQPGAGDRATPTTELSGGNITVHKG